LYKPTVYTLIAYILIIYSAAERLGLCIQLYCIMFWVRVSIYALWAGTGRQHLAD